MKKVLVITGILLISLLLAAAAMADSTLTLPAFLTSVEEYAFEGNISVTRVILPDGICDIGEGSFCGCSSLETINIPENVTSIGSSAFSGCASLTEIDIPEGVTFIGSGAFSGCSSLTEITLPDSLTSIGENAFPAGTTVICSAGSFAGEWCGTHGIPCVTESNSGILRQPRNVQLPAGEYAVFSVEAENAKSYQWQVLRSDKPWANTYLTGYDSPSLTVQANYNRAVLKWRCEITLNDDTVVYTDAAALSITEQKIEVTATSSISYDVPLYDQGSYPMCWNFSMQMVEDYMMGTIDPNATAAEKQADATADCIERSKELFGDDWNSGYYPYDTEAEYLSPEDENVTLENIYTLLVKYGPGYLSYGQYILGYRITGHITVITGVDLATGLITSNNPWGVSGSQTLKEMKDRFYTGRHSIDLGWELEFVDMPLWDLAYGTAE